ncbi:uncharacterized protein BJ212DRAFT_1307631 [Suillus subaureus]|uniref:Uncharacterized protein n=1 Tax=Suillus subaureus TaxID=48587 RepID=A0A9P7AKS0_9AGAM|nr:uncharacterized protein BJ212DRAFT_1307631 [Suillus subaureus]KAG1791266.1 hypothetical protein BJ212DRAFT_1307631 [Suillus subaureus]
MILEWPTRMDLVYFFKRPAIDRSKATAAASMRLAMKFARSKAAIRYHIPSSIPWQLVDRWFGGLSSGVTVKECHSGVTFKMTVGVGFANPHRLRQKYVPIVYERDLRGWSRGRRTMDDRRDDRESDKGSKAYEVDEL